MLQEVVDRENVDKLVHAFYAKVLKDDHLRPYFTKALGEDRKAGKWHEHHHTLINFWLLMMTGRRGYGGHPFPPHAFLGQLYPESFERWLELFNETVHEHYVPVIAEKFNRKANIFAVEFMDNLGFNDEDDD